MKIAKPRLDQLLFIYAPFALTGVLLSYFFSDKILLFFKAFMLITLIVTIIITLIPFARQKPLGSPATTALPNNHWLVKILLLQLGVLFIFIGFSQAFIQFISNNSTLDATLLMQQTLNFYQGGLWPWPFIALISAAITYLGRAEKKPALLRKAVQPLLKKYADNIIGIGIEIFLKQGLFYSILLTIGIITLQIAHIISQTAHLPSLFNFTLPAFISSIFLISFFANNPFIKLLTRKIGRQPYAENKLILIFCCSSIAILLIFNITITSITTHFFHYNSQQPLTTFINRTPYLNQWLLLSVIWWIGIMPLLTRTIATLSHTLSLRKHLVASLLMPLGFNILWQLSNRFLPYHLQTILHTLTTCWPIMLAWGIASLLITALLFRNPNTSGIATCTKTCHPAPSGTVTSLRTLWQLSTFTLAILLTINVSFLTFFGAAFTFPIVGTLLLTLLACCLTAFTHN